jgi:hypothetical protein
MGHPGAPDAGLSRLLEVWSRRKGLAISSSWRRGVTPDILSPERHLVAEATDTDGAAGRRRLTGHRAGRAINALAASPCTSSTAVIGVPIPWDSVDGTGFGGSMWAIWTALRYPRC